MLFENEININDPLTLQTLQQQQTLMNISISVSRISVSERPLLDVGLA